MIPLKDDNPTESFPILTIALIVINVAVFVVQIFYSDIMGDFTKQLAVIPARFGQENGALQLFNKSAFKVNPYLTLMSYAFLHGSIPHLLLNMLFLWVFGNNIEDALGRVKFIIFYLVCGIAAALLHIQMSGGSPTPLVGASGAIAGILGAYMLLYPHAHIQTLFFIIIFIKVIRVPAIFFIGFWFLMQILNVTGGAKDSNVAWYAHIGGFVAGVILIIIFNPKDKRKQKGKTQKRKRHLRVVH